MTERRARRARDPLAAHDERPKPSATTVNAAGIGLPGFAVLRPATEGPSNLGAPAAAWSAVAVALRLPARHIPGRPSREVDDDAL